MKNRKMLLLWRKQKGSAIIRRFVIWTIIIRIMYVFYAFKCKLKELTTKSVFSARGPRSFGMRMPSSSLRPRVIQWRGDFPSCCVVHATRLLSATFVPPPPHPPPPTMVLLPLIFFSAAGSRSFPSVWGLVAGLRCCGSPGILQAPNLHFAMRLWMKKASKKLRASTRIETNTFALPTEPWSHPRRYTFLDIPLPTQSLTLPFFVSSLNSFSPQVVLRDDPKELLRNRLARPLLYCLCSILIFFPFVIGHCHRNNAESFFLGAACWVR